MPVSRIFRNEEFGYRTITVERPKRISYVPSAKGIKILEDSKTSLQTAMAFQLRPMIAVGSRMLEQGGKYKTLVDFRAAAQAVGQELGHRLTDDDTSALANCFAHPDGEGDIMLNGKGKPVVNTALRDTENVPLSEDVDAYFKREGAATRARRLDRHRRRPRSATRFRSTGTSTSSKPAA